MKHTLALGSYVVFFAVLYVVFCCTTLSAQGLSDPGLSDPGSGGKCNSGWTYTKYNGKDMCTK